MLISAARSLFLAGIVATTSPYGELAVSGSTGFDPDGAVSARTLGCRGFVTDGVLIANVTGNRAADLVYFVQRSGKKCDASGSLTVVFFRRRVKL